MAIIQKRIEQQGFAAAERTLARYILDHAEEAAGIDIAAAGKGHPHNREGGKQ